jgi:hypothetical protein
MRWRPGSPLRRSVGLGCALATVAMAIGALSAQVDAAPSGVLASRLYWTLGATGDHRISSANLDGSNVDESTVTLPSDLGAVQVTTTGHHIYWAGFDEIKDDTEIGTARLNGSHARPLLRIDGGVSGMVARGRLLFLATGEGLDLVRLGSHRRPRQLVREIGLVDVAVGKGRIYWCNYGQAPVSASIHSANLDGTQRRRYVIPNLHSPVSLLLAGGFLYWSNSETQTTIGRIKSDGTDVEPTFLTIGGFAVGLAWHKSTLYWASSSLGQAGALNEIGFEELTSEGRPIGTPRTVLPIPEDQPPYSFALR